MNYFGFKIKRKQFFNVRKYEEFLNFKLSVENIK